MSVAPPAHGALLTYEAGRPRRLWCLAGKAHVHQGGAGGPRLGWGGHRMGQHQLLQVGLAEGHPIGAASLEQQAGLGAWGQGEGQRQLHGRGGSHSLPRHSCRPWDCPACTQGSWGGGGEWKGLWQECGAGRDSRRGLPVAQCWAERSSPGAPT